MKETDKKDWTHSPYWIHWVINLNMIIIQCLFTIMIILV